jgi:hypothetical protein
MFREPTMKIALPVLALFASFALSCSSSSSGTNDNPTDSGSSKDTGNGGGDVGSETSDDAGDCPTDVDPPPPPGSTCVRHVTGNLVDEKGAPLPVHSSANPDGLVVTVCGSVCYFADPGPTAGSFDVHVGFLIPVSTYNIIVHGLGDHASSYRAVPTVGSDGNVAVSEKIVAPVFDKIGAPLPADTVGGTVSAGNVTLVVPAGASFELDPDFVALGDPGRVLKAYKWTATAMPSFAASANLAQLVALGPFASKSCKTPPCAAGDSIKMSVSMTNDTSLAAGAAVEFLTLGFDLFATPFTAGQMNVVAKGHVSADGKTIDTDSGEGIDTISWLGVRLKP